MERSVRSDRNKLFQELKPCCVELSQLALKTDGNPKSLLEPMRRLLNLLQGRCRRSDGVFDEKLADYVFFPLSQVLRRKQTFRLTELMIKCLRVLLEFGWRKWIALDLAKQLLILLTLLAEDVAAPEELRVETFEALVALFHSLQFTPSGPAVLVEIGTLPAVGQAATVILEGITKGPTLEALRALSTLWKCIKEPQALSSFLPATVSTLTKLLSRKLESRRKTTIMALEVLQQVLVSLLSDVRTRTIRNEADSPPDAVHSNQKSQKTLTKSWLKATTAQIKLALANVVRIRSNVSSDVRSTLNTLTLVLLDECHETLADSASMLVETSLALTAAQAQNASEQTNLLTLALIHPDIGELIRNTIYNWVTTLPRVMQSNDETHKQAMLYQLSGAYSILAKLAPGSDILEDTLLSSLRDSAAHVFKISSPEKVQEATFDTTSQAIMTFASDHALTRHFHPLLMSRDSQKQTREQLHTFLTSMGTSSQQTRMASEMLDYARDASGDSMVSAYWLAYHLSKAASSKHENLQEFIHSTLISSDEQQTFDEEIFSYAVTLLSSDDERHTDWRMQAISLEVLADSAGRMKTSFRTEFIDVLYPVTKLLGAPHQGLREHAITCLNLLSIHCAYPNTKDMIIENVDYLVNAISLRLNTFDISPQAPQVLIMMIRLTGPSLLLYLDDVVDSIFAALDNFHGYERLVEVLFSVLGEIVEVGSKSDQLQIEFSPVPTNHRKAAPTYPTIEEIVASIKSQHRKDPRSADSHSPHESAPHQPWKSATTLLNEFIDPLPSTNLTEEVMAPESPTPKPTKIHQLLHRITLLSQHYLTHSSPHLRTKLLSLLGTSLSALPSSSDTYLPLINDIWPVLLPRLYDSEFYVVLAACSAISVVCEKAGDFMSGRIDVEWGRLMRCSKRWKAEMERERRGMVVGSRGDRGAYAQGHRVWEAVVGLLCSIIEYVRISDEMVDDVLSVLGDEIVNGRKEVRDCLEAIDADKVWFELYAGGAICGTVMKRPEAVDGREFLDYDFT